jgi:hypothetical protein
MIHTYFIILQHVKGYINAESNPDSEIYFTSQSEHKQINIKVEEDPLLITIPFVKAENEVSCVSLCCCAL